MSFLGLWLFPFLWSADCTHCPPTARISFFHPLRVTLFCRAASHFFWHFLITWLAWTGVTVAAAAAAAAHSRSAACPHTRAGLPSLQPPPAGRRPPRPRIYKTCLRVRRPPPPHPSPPYVPPHNTNVTYKLQLVVRRFSCSLLQVNPPPETLLTHSLCKMNLTPSCFILYSAAFGLATLVFDVVIP